MVNNDDNSIHLTTPESLSQRYGEFNSSDIQVIVIGMSAAVVMMLLYGIWAGLLPIGLMLLLLIRVLHGRVYAEMFRPLKDAYLLIAKKGVIWQARDLSVSKTKGRRFRSK